MALPDDVVEPMQAQMNILDRCLAEAAEAHLELVSLVRDNPTSQGVLTSILNTGDTYGRLLIDGIGFEESLGRHWVRPERADRRTDPPDRPPREPFRLTALAVVPPDDVVEAMQAQMNVMSSCFDEADEAHSELVLLVKDNPVGHEALAAVLSLNPDDSYAQLLIDGVDLDEALGRRWNLPQ